MRKNNVSRRKFFKKSVTGLASAGLFLTGNDKKSPLVFLPRFPNPDEYKIKKYRPLGNLGFKASDVSIGTTGATDPSLLSFGLDCGVNFIDTAHGYGGGNAERDIGLVLKNRKEKVWINTKFAREAWRKDNVGQGLMDSLDESLTRLQLEQVDSIMVHNASSDDIRNDQLHSFFEKAKKAGKVRFLGISTHDPRGAAERFEEAVDDERFNIILTIYGIYSAQETAKYFKKAFDKGKAIIAMKTLSAAYDAKIKDWDKLEKRTVTRRGRNREQVDYTPAFIQSALAWVLNNQYVSTAVKRLQNMDDLKNMMSASGVKYGYAHKKFLESYGVMIKGSYCRIGCSECYDACPNNVAINDIMRYKMYFENYKSEKEGIVCYRELPDENKAIACKDCSAPCTDFCDLGVDIKAELLRAHEMLTI